MRIDLDLIQGLGISLGSFHYLIQWPKSSKTFISGGLRIITSSLLLSLLAVAFFLSSNLEQNSIPSPFAWILDLLDQRVFVENHFLKVTLSSHLLGW